jgi:hypothetical protein
MNFISPYLVVFRNKACLAIVASMLTFSPRILTLSYRQQEEAEEEVRVFIP